MPHSAIISADHTVSILSDKPDLFDAFAALMEKKGATRKGHRVTFNVAALEACMDPRVMAATTLADKISIVLEKNGFQFGRQENPAKPGHPAATIFSITGRKVLGQPLAFLAATAPPPHVSAQVQQQSAIPQEKRARQGILAKAINALLGSSQPQFTG